MIWNERPRPAQYNDNDLEAYENLVRQTVKPYEMWKYENIPRDIPDDVGDTNSEGFDAASVGDVGESSDISSPGLASPASTLKPVPPLPSPPSPAHTRARASRKAKNAKERKHPYEGYGVVYLPGDINGLTKKLHLLAAEFFADNTTVRNELVHVLDALLRLKQLMRKEYTNITARLATSL